MGKFFSGNLFPAIGCLSFDGNDIPLHAVLQASISVSGGPVSRPSLPMPAPVLTHARARA